MHRKKFLVIYILTKMELGGAQKVCLSLFNGVKNENIDSLILTSHGKLSEFIEDPQIHYIDRKFNNYIKLYDIVLLFKLIKKLRHLKNANKNTEIVVHTHSTKAGILGRWAAFFAGIKIRVHTIHGFAFHNYQSFISWYIIYLVELVTNFITTHFICVSSEDVKIAKKLFPGFASKHSIIRAAVDWQNFYISAHKKESDEPKSNLFVFGTISCFKPQKNLLDLLKSFEVAYKENPLIRLEIIGDGELRSQIENFIKLKKLSHVVVLHGWQEHVAPYMLNWDAFVLSSLWEGLPCAVVEARLLKLPVLSYNTGGIHDVIISGKNGFLYKQKDWMSLACGMLNLSINKELYKSLKNYSQDLSDFKNENMIKEHIELYKRIVYKIY